MELVDGGNLLEAIDENRTRHEDMARQITWQICDAVGVRLPFYVDESLDTKHLSYLTVPPPTRRHTP